MLQGCCPLACLYQQRPGTCGTRSLQVAQRITDQRYARQFDSQAFCNIDQQSWLRLATPAMVFRCMGTEEYGIDLPTGIPDCTAHLLMNAHQCVQVEQATSNPGLVGCHYYTPACPVQSCDCSQAAGNWMPLTGRLDVVVRVLVDDTVAIENYQLHEDTVDTIGM